MPHYLIQVAYTPEAWATLVKKPQNRIDAVRPVVEQAGGKIEAAYLAFGKYDVVVMVDMPDNVSAAAFAIDVSAGGAVKAIRTTPLMTWEEGIAAMKKAGQISYKPPS